MKDAMLQSNRDGQKKGEEAVFWDAQVKGKYLKYEKKVYAAFREKEYLEIIKKGLADFDYKYGGKVLDIGCGAGVSTIILANLGFDAIGIDISPNLIDEAKNLSKDTEVSWMTPSGRPEGVSRFIVGDVSKLDFKDESIDVCFLAGLLHHFPDYEPVLKEIHRVLKNGGIMIACEPNKLNLPHQLSFYLVNKKKGVSPNEFPLSPIEAEKNIKKYFRNIKMSQFRENDVPFLRQLGWIGRGPIGDALRVSVLFLKNNFFPKNRRGTFFIASCQK